MLVFYRERAGESDHPGGVRTTLPPLSSGGVPGTKEIFLAWRCTLKNLFVFFCCLFLPICWIKTPGKDQRPKFGGFAAPNQFQNPKRNFVTQTPNPKQKHVLCPQAIQRTNWDPLFININFLIPSSSFWRTMTGMRVKRSMCKTAVVPQPFHWLRCVWPRGWVTGFLGMTDWFLAPVPP